MICAQFIFKPGTYDDDFHRLDSQIDEYARSLPGFEKFSINYWLAWNPRLLRLNPHASRRRDKLIELLSQKLTEIS